MAGKEQLAKRTKALIDQEQQLRDRAASATLTEEQRQRLQSLRAELDHCWRLLRERSERRHNGRQPSPSSDPVEGRLGI